MNRDETCARCGHSSNGCARCRRMDPFLGAYIEGRPYCHTFSPSVPSCYTQTIWTESHDRNKQQPPKSAVGGYRNLRGECPSCGEWKAVRKDGLMMRHSFGGRYLPCIGSLSQPKQIILTPYQETQYLAGDAAVTGE